MRNVETEKFLRVKCLTTAEAFEAATWKYVVVTSEHTAHTSKPHVLRGERKQLISQKNPADTQLLKSFFEESADGKSEVCAALGSVFSLGGVTLC